MASKARYINSVRTEKMIYDAYTKLLWQKPMNKITVSDVVKLAGINRGTFYLHYPDINALVEIYENEIINTLMEIASITSFPEFCRNPMPILTEIGDFLESQIDTNRAFSRFNTSDALFNERIQNAYIEKRCADAMAQCRLSYVTPEECRQIVSFISGGMMKLYHDWLRSDPLVPVATINKALAELIRSCGKLLE